ncbi:HU family DNA-binding protein [Acidimangrovimonas pyrenivorans]|uniref:HU family DNA-binding protein n=1 Tax=Acidimangrovimonas pyrenivorans TaxID=2030798 RepID=A0ABV7AJH6_9RHOB
MATPPKKTSRGKRSSAVPAPRPSSAAGAAGAAARAAAEPAPLAPGRAGVSLETPSTAAAKPSGQEAKPLHRKELFGRVMAMSGAKKKDVKPIAEAVLTVLGAALEAGEELNLPPLGKVRIARRNANGAAEVLTLKLRRPTGTKESGKAPLAVRDGGR